MRVVRSHHWHRIGSGEAKPCFWRADSLPATCVLIGNTLALAGHRGRRADRGSRGVHILVRPPVATDVFGYASDAPGWRGFLADVGGMLRVDRVAILRHGLGTRQVRRDKPLNSNSATAVF